MSGRIPPAFIDDLLVRIDIVDLIDKHVPLKKTGSNYVARCPFHSEKTPSFSVNRSKQLYKCFGCGASGNAIGFLMDFNHLGFVEAVEDLAGFAGLTLPHEAFKQQVVVDKPDLSSVYRVLAEAADFYAERLRTDVQAKSAITYLKKRGMQAETIKRFQLGFAADEWQRLSSRFDKKVLLRAGLAIDKADGSCYDRFRGRLMFPIRDRRGRVVGFGARVLDDSLPKYLNSPETEVFQKGREAYGLYELLAQQSRPERILVVEGYMDVIALAQAGIHYAVATLGTATSKAHLDLLFRFTSEIVLCFDGDAAGRQAAWRAMEVVFVSLKEGRQVRVLLLPEGEDPDSLIRSEGLQRFKERIASAQALSEYFFDYLQIGLDLAGIEGRAKLMETASPFLVKLPEGVFRDMMFARLRDLAGVRERQNIVDSFGFVQAAPKQRNSLQSMPNKQAFGSGRPSVIRLMLTLLLQYPHLAEHVCVREQMLRQVDFPGLSLLQKIAQLIAVQAGTVNAAIILQAFRDAPEEKTVKALLALEVITPPEGVEKEFCDGLDGLIKQARKHGIGPLLEKKLSELDQVEREALKKMDFKPES